jgi:hypothetical protein
MNLLYGICYYEGSGKTHNITRHVDIFNSLDVEDKQFVVTLMSDNPDPPRPAEVPDDAIVINSFNWGGTIAGLWNFFKEFKDRDPDTMTAFFEEDFYPTNPTWLVDARQLLDDDNIYVGEHIPSTDNEINHNNTKFKKEIGNWGVHGIKAVSVYRDLTELRWTDGGFYFSTIENLSKIENKIGVFHKGDQTTKYNHTIDGILLGEVGFPSLVNKHFKFTGLTRDKYFNHGG